MKLVKLSLCAMLAVGALVSSVGANEFSDAMSNGKFKGQIKADYYTKYANTSVPQTSLLLFALRMNYVTGDFYGFSAGASSQTVTAPGSNSSNAEKYFGGKYAQYGEGSVLSESYLAYKYNKTSVRIGRQYIDMPLIESVVSRTAKSSYSGVTAIDNSLPDTTLQGAYITMIQQMTDGSTGIGDFEALDDDDNHAYMISAINESVKGLNLMAAYGEYQKNYKIYEGEAQYNLKLDSLNYGAAIKHAQTDYDASTSGNPYFTTAKIGAGMKGYSAYLAYSNVDAKKGTVASHGIINASDSTILSGLYTTSYVGAGDYFAQETAGLLLEYKKPGLRLMLRYFNTDIENEATNGSDYERVMFKGIYKISKDLIGVGVYGADFNEVAADSSQEFRLRLIYNF
jgi:hypothetical protein